VPRKDRSFTSSDVSRIYCKLLTQEERADALRELLLCNAIDETGTDAVVAALSTVLDLLDLTSDINPLSNLMSKLVELLIVALETPMSRQELVDALLLGEPAP